MRGNARCMDHRLFELMPPNVCETFVHRVAGFLRKHLLHNSATIIADLKTLAFPKLHIGPVRNAPPGRHREALRRRHKGRLITESHIVCAAKVASR